MIFTSLQFLIFFSAMFFVYFALPHRWRWVLLLAGSYYFYMCWRMEYIFLIVLSTLVDYVAGIGISTATTARRRRAWLAASLTGNLGMLFYFKYYNFFADSTRALFNHFNVAVHIPALQILLPVGISFYTFQTLAYTLDVYMGKRNAERHLGIFALYVTFFPQLVAGPIERSTQLMPQLRTVVRFDYPRVVSGLRLMLWGFVKKMLIADRLALVVNATYGAPNESTAAQLLVATVCFAFQIYCDFSAYSDIAIGSARVLGIDLMQNFRQPYFSTSITEFWRRWHISLSTWFRDYVYMPLGGNRRGGLQTAFNLTVVFLVSGLWHGANWTFVVWGGLHACYMLAERFLYSGDKAKRSGDLSLLRRIAQTLVTFSLVCLAWIFFRATTLGEAFLICEKVLTALLNPMQTILIPLAHLGGSAKFALALIGTLLVLEFVHQRINIEKSLPTWPLPVRWAIYYAGILAILLLGEITSQDFIYFQF